MGRHERKGESDGICSDTQTQTEIAAGPPIVWQAQRWGRQGLAEQVLGINHRPVRGELRRRHGNSGLPKCRGGCSPSSSRLQECRAAAFFLNESQGRPRYRLKKGQTGQHSLVVII
eukprot:EG_transcript_33383